MIADAIRDPDRGFLRDYSLFVVDRANKGALDGRGFVLLAEDPQALVYRRTQP